VELSVAVAEVGEEELALVVVVKAVTEVDDEELAVVTVVVATVMVAVGLVLVP